MTDRHSGKPPFNVQSVLDQIDTVLTHGNIATAGRNEIIYLDMLNVARRTIVQLRDQLDRMNEAYIAASNPGIDIEAVRAARNGDTLLSIHEERA